jgi:tetratricopeptide (TPR) repeat protein
MKHSIFLYSVVFAAVGMGWFTPVFVVQAKAPPKQVEQIHLRSGKLPSVKLTADILYRILASEIAAQRDQYDMASQTLLDLARDTLDPRLAKRAFQFAMADHNMLRGQKAAQEWALLAPNDPEAVATSLALAATNGQTAGLAAALRARIEKATDKDDAIAQSAGIVGKMSDKKAALDVLDKALVASTRSLPVAHLALADAAWAAGEAARAVSEARQALALDPNSEPAAQRLLEYGFKTDPVAAIAATRAFLEKHPEARKLQLMLVGSLVDRDDFNGALTQIRLMRARSPEDFDLLYTEARINFSAGHYAEAESLLQEYINVQTQRRRSVNDNVTNAVADVADARLLLVQIAEKQNRLDDAIRQLELIDDPSLRFQVRIHQAVLQARQGDLSKARATIAALKPQDKNQRAVAALTLASIYRESGRTDLAAQDLAQADKELPDTPEIKYALAMLYERQGKIDEFEALMRRVIELQPTNADAYNSLGYTMVDQNRRLDEARDLLEHALDMEPDNPFIQDSVGWYFYRVGDNLQAMEYQRRAYAQMPSADVAAHLGEVLWKMKRLDEAKEIWRAGLGKDAKNETLLNTLKRLGIKL